MDQLPMMLYRAPGPEQIHGLQLSTLIVRNREALDAAIADGWFPETTDAQAAYELARDHAASEAAQREAAVDARPPTRVELEMKARELDVAFSGKTADATLAKLIAAKLAA